jgi:hypothetical protein
VDVTVEVTPELRGSELFDDLRQASAFFERGAKGYSPAGGGALQGMELHTDAWRLDACRIVSAHSSFFDGLPQGSATLDCALVMRHVPITWRPLPTIPLARPSLSHTSATYEAERRPVALELADLTVRSQAARFGPNPQDDPMDPILCILGQRYLSTAMIGPGHETVFGDTVRQHARPGTRAPHLWLDRDGRRIGVHDLFHDSFVLLTGPATEALAAAAANIDGLRTYRAGTDVLDVEDAWQARYGDGAVLVRPDGYVAWRADGDLGDPERTLRDALHRILH